jgi:lysophospholipase L1-like esterase
MFSSKKSMFYLLLLLLLFVGVVVIATIVRVNQTNSLLNNPRWLPTKKLKGMMAGDAFKNERQSLAGNMLNLGTWGGYQEVLFTTPVTPKDFSCKCRFEEGAFLYVIFDRQEDGFWSLRLSETERFPNAIIKSNVKGEFLSIEPISIPLIKRGIWENIKLSFQEGSVKANINGQMIDLQMPFKLRSGQFGFRNGNYPVSVDDVCISDALTGKVFYESFNGTQFDKALSYVFPRIGAFLLVLLALGRIILKTWRKIFEHVIAIMLTLILAGGVFAAFHFFVLAKRYPVLPPVTGNHSVEQDEIKHRVQNAKKNWNSALSGNGKRILFLGSSQAEGLGANDPSECYVADLERTLNEKCGANPRIYCLNAGFGGYQTRQELFAYKECMADIHADLVVFIMSCNDSMVGETPENYTANIESIINTARDRGAKILMAKEPASPEQYPNGFRLDSELQRIAEKAVVPLIDASADLRNKYSTGFLFVDFVHLTSYGHELVAKLLTDPILQLLDIPECSPPSGNAVQP